MSVIWCVSVRIISAVRARARAARDGLSSYRWCMAGRGRLDCTQDEERGALCFSYSCQARDVHALIMTIVPQRV